MADYSVLVPAGGRSLLADSSVFDTKLAETSKENLFAGTADVDEDMPQVETRVVLVQDAGRNEAVLKALETVKLMEVPVIKIRDNCHEKSRESFIKSIVNMVWSFLHAS